MYSGHTRLNLTLYCIIWFILYNDYSKNAKTGYALLCMKIINFKLLLILLIVLTFILEYTVNIFGYSFFDKYVTAKLLNVL